MDEAPQKQTEPATGGTHVTTLLAVGLLAALLLWANYRPENRTFQNADVTAHGWPLPMLYMEVNHDATKLSPPRQLNLVSLYYDITVCVLILVLAGAFIERYTRWLTQPAAENASPTLH